MGRHDTELQKKKENVVEIDNDWLDDASRAEEEAQVDEYDIVSAPNDWNFSTLVSFIESGALKIPNFQRSYVWDRKRASKLIESLIIGLPVPQVFLYEEAKNKFIVIDGQQRLLTLYFFSKERFPKPKVRGELRSQLLQGMPSKEMLDNGSYFEPFKLSLPKGPGDKESKYHGLTYTELGEDRTSLDLRTMRNIVVKQTSPAGDKAIFEIFNRLNTGGMNLSPQEIRASLYHSEFFARIIELNSNADWRSLLNQEHPDGRMRDTEFLLRAVALGDDSDSYSGTMTNFVNKYCHRATKFNQNDINERIDNIGNFIRLLTDYPETFIRSGKFSGVLFESAFAAWALERGLHISGEQLSEKVVEVKESATFADTLQEGSTKPANIGRRIALLRESYKEV